MFAVLVKLSSSTPIVEISSPPDDSARGLSSLSFASEQFVLTPAPLAILEPNNHDANRKIASRYTKT
ncbi:hypothetical protein BT63DRAFT_100527 [Microthyrium microscopicum]|uniref:Uncharacterized protein n=1 Tax=Microthyrium microscopicum TaxID=703497 RepID=A0A6A6TWH1_9PEZI|nr:hypothetical protein BT63DRAFT_100527 [Microthyrium microscopicum]